MNRHVAVAIGYALIILAASSIPGQSYPGHRLFTYDKVLHFIEYSGFAFLLAWANPGQRSAWLMVAFASAFGMGDELYQSLIPGRDSSVADWVADTAGAVAGVAVFVTWRRRK